MSVAGENILVDCGSSSDKKIGENVLVPFLKSQAIGRLDKVFVTHADSDHTSGILYLLDESDITIDELYLPAQAKGDAEYDDLIYEIKKENAGAADRKNVGETLEQKVRRNIDVKYISAGDAVILSEDRSGKGSLRSGSDSTAIHCISPVADANPSDMNDQSLVLLYREGNFGLLLMGDASKETEGIILDRLKMPKKSDTDNVSDNQSGLDGISNISVLKVGHHGSKSSTSEELLDATDPLYAILSYGEGNRYGHPNIETTQLLQDHGIRCESTARSGALTFTIEENKLRLSRYVHD